MAGSVCTEGRDGVVGESDGRSYPRAGSGPTFFNFVSILYHPPLLDLG